MLLHDKCHHIPRFYRIENRTRHTRHCKSTWAMFLFGNINFRSAPMKAVADRKPLELKIRTKNDQGLVCMVLAYPSYLNSLLQLPWSINPIIGKTSLNGIFTLGIYATSGVSWIVVLIVPFENKTGCFHHAGSFFLPPILKRKRRSSSVGQYEAPLNQLPTFVPLSARYLSSQTQAFWIPDKRSFSGLKGIGGLVKPSKVQWMLHKSFEYTGGFGLGSRPSVERETIEKMA